MSAPRRSFSQMFLTPVGPQNFHLRAQRDHARGDTLIFFGDTGHRSRDRALADEALKLFIGAQAQHLFPATGRIPFPEIEENDVEQALEFERCLGRKHGY